MLILPTKTPEELQALSFEVARGMVLTGMHVTLYPDIPDSDKGALLKSIFRPLQVMASPDWLEFQRLQCVPYQHMRESIRQMAAGGTGWPVFNTMELLSWKDALLVVLTAGEIHQSNPAPGYAGAKPR
jgi:hypothetical protein